MGMMKRFLADLGMDEVMNDVTKPNLKPVVEETTRSVRVNLTTTEYSACFREALRRDQLPGVYIKEILLDRLEGRCQRKV